MRCHPGAVSFAVTLVLAIWTTPIAAQLHLKGNQLFEPGVNLPGSASSFDNCGVVAAGDFDGDEWDDLAIGVYGEDVKGHTNCGAVHVVYGSGQGLDSGRIQTLIRGVGRVEGSPQQSAWFGAVLAAGDLNGDGIADLAVGAPGQDLARYNCGLVHIFYGVKGVGLSTATDHELYQGQYANTDVAQQNDHFGYSLAIGDFDGNGSGDLAVGAPYDSVGTQPNAGLVIEYRSSLKTGLATPKTRVLHQDVLFMSDIAENQDLFGASLASGDFDGDGIDDLSIGVPGESSASYQFAGAVSVLHGQLFSGLRPQTNAHYTIFAGGMASRDVFGRAQIAADLNGDGADDLVVGAPYRDSNNSGAVTVRYGVVGSGLEAGSSLIFTEYSSGIDSSPMYQENFGTAFATGDFNGDQVDDLAIGAHRGEAPISRRGGFVDAGGVHALYGESGSFLSLNSTYFNEGIGGMSGTPMTGELFGSKLAAGDFNGDGADDLAIGIWSNDQGSLSNVGAVAVLYGYGQ